MNETVTNNDRKSVAAIILLVLAGVALWVASWLWLKGYPIRRSPQRFRIVFHNAAGLTNHAAVYSDGVRVGSIESIVLQQPHQVVVSVRVDEQNIAVPKDAQFFIHANGLIGARYIDIVLPNSPGTAAVLNEQSLVSGVDPINLDKVTEDAAAKIESFDVAELRRSTRHLAIAADNVSSLTRKFESVGDSTIRVERQVGLLTRNLNGTAGKINRIMRDPKFSATLASVAHDARDAASMADDAMCKLQTVAADPALRADIKEMLTTACDAAHDIRLTASEVEKLGSDRDLRDDAKKIISDARRGVETLDALMRDPSAAGDVKSTLTEARRAFARIDTVGAQLGQVLDKRAPVMQMMFGRPGHLKPETMCAPQSQYE